MEVPRHWRIQPQRYLLEGSVCPACGKKSFPFKEVCPQCSQTPASAYVFSGKGTIYSYSTVFHPPEGFEEYVPYWVALVKLEEGPLIAAQLADVEAEKIAIGMPVEMVTRKLREDGKNGMVIYGYKFRPLRNA
jgi:hypothetical protein